MPKVTSEVSGGLEEAGEQLQGLAEKASDIGGAETGLARGITGGTPFGGSSSLPEYLNMGIAYGILLTGFLCVVFVIWGGIKLILSHGDQEKVKQAVSTIRHSVFGLVVAVLAVVLVATVGKAFGLDILQYLDYESIVEIIQGVTGGSEAALDAGKEALGNVQ